MHCRANRESCLHLCPSRFLLESIAAWSMSDVIDEYTCQNCHQRSSVADRSPSSSQYHLITLPHVLCISINYHGWDRRLGAATLVPLCPRFPSRFAMPLASFSVPPAESYEREWSRPSHRWPLRQFCASLRWKLALQERQRLSPPSQRLCGCAISVHLPAASLLLLLQHTDRGVNSDIVATTHDDRADAARRRRPNAPSHLKDRSSERDERDGRDKMDESEERDGRDEMHLSEREARATRSATRETGQMIWMRATIEGEMRCM